VLQLDDVPTPVPRQGEVRIRVEAIGLNRAEVMFRQGAYLEQPQLPSLIGYEASGIVEEVGPGVVDLKPGDKVSSIPSFSNDSIRYLWRGRGAASVLADEVPLQAQFG
jgi:NADPH:quinone reductase